MRIVVSEFVTADGVMGDPGGAEKTPNGGWSFQFWSDDAAKYKLDELLASDALLLGRVTYAGFAQAWPSMKDEAGYADKMNGMRKYVVSTTLQSADWNNSHIIGANVVDEVRKLKQQPGKNLLVFGSATLVRSLMNYGLVDEYRLMVHPVAVGGGKRLFDGVERKNVLKLVDTKPIAAGVVVLTYEPAEASPSA